MDGPSTKASAADQVTQRWENPSRYQSLTSPSTDGSASLSPQRLRSTGVDDCANKLRQLTTLSILVKREGVLQAPPEYPDAALVDVKTRA